MARKQTISRYRANKMIKDHFSTIEGQLLLRDPEVNQKALKKLQFLLLRQKYNIK
jgi:hypothetical protein